jgi:hypothetical protein
MRLDGRSGAGLAFHLTSTRRSNGLRGRKVTGSSATAFPRPSARQRELLGSGIVHGTAAGGDRQRPEDRACVSLCDYLLMARAEGRRTRWCLGRARLAADHQGRSAHSARPDLRRGETMAPNSRWLRITGFTLRPSAPGELCAGATAMASKPIDFGTDRSAPPRGVRASFGVDRRTCAIRRVLPGSQQ